MAEAVKQRRTIMEGLNYKKGPWKYQEGADVYTHIVRTKDNAFICQLSQNSSGESEATARLMAAAPEMIESLIAAFLGEVTASDDIRYKWQKIIEKATGMSISEGIDATARHDAER